MPALGNSSPSRQPRRSRRWRSPPSRDPLPLLQAQESASDAAAELEARLAEAAAEQRHLERRCESLEAELEAARAGFEEEQRQLADRLSAELDETRQQAEAVQALAAQLEESRREAAAAQALAGKLEEQAQREAARAADLASQLEAAQREAAAVQGLAAQLEQQAATTERLAAELEAARSEAVAAAELSEQLEEARAESATMAAELREAKKAVALVSLPGLSMSHPSGLLWSLFTSHVTCRLADGLALGSVWKHALHRSCPLLQGGGWETRGVMCAQGTPGPGSCHKSCPLSLLPAACSCPACSHSWLRPPRPASGLWSSLPSLRPWWVRPLDSGQWLAWLLSLIHWLQALVKWSPLPLLSKCLARVKPAHAWPLQLCSLPRGFRQSDKSPATCSRLTPR